MIENSIYVCGGCNYQYKHLESLERLRVSDVNGVAVGARWEVLDVRAPKLWNFLMVPITSSEILFLGGWRDGRAIGEVSVLDLQDLKQTVLLIGHDYSFDS